MVERIKEGTVIITGGRIYALFHELNPTDNNVCRKCALHTFCMEKDAIPTMCHFCTKGLGRSDAFFLECFPTQKKSVREIACEQNFLETAASEDEATAGL